MRLFEFMSVLHKKVADQTEFDNGNFSKLVLNIRPRKPFCFLLCLFSIKMREHV